MAQILLQNVNKTPLKYSMEILQAMSQCRLRYYYINTISASICALHGLIKTLNCKLNYSFIFPLFDVDYVDSSLILLVSFQG